MEQSYWVHALPTRGCPGMFSVAIVLYLKENTPTSKHQIIKNLYDISKVS